MGIFMAAAVAFRAFFVTRNHSKASTPPGKEDRFFSSNFVKKFRKRGVSALDSDNEGGLPNIPGAQLTGMRTIIDGQGKSQMEQSCDSHASKGSRCPSDVEAIALSSYASSGK